MIYARNRHTQQTTWAPVIMLEESQTTTVNTKRYLLSTHVRSIQVIAFRKLCYESKKKMEFIPRNQKWIESHMNCWPRQWKSYEIGPEQFNYLYCSIMILQISFKNQFGKYWACD